MRDAEESPGEAETTMVSSQRQDAASVVWSAASCRLRGRVSVFCAARNGFAGGCFAALRRTVGGGWAYAIMPV